MTIFRIRGVCSNPRCRVTEFTSARKKGTYTSTDGHTRPVQRITCPECRMWGDVVQIEGVAG